MVNLDTLRQEMIDTQLAARGITDPATLQAMRQVPREAFVGLDLREFAYEDSPLPIEEGQTISQPYIVALMIQELELASGERALEIGTGSGYAAAVLSRIASDVCTVERYHSLASNARRRFAELGYTNIHVLEGDGTLGWAAHAPYDAIIVSAGGPSVPPALIEQLAVNGRLIIPVGPTQRTQKLLRLRRINSKTIRREELTDVRFVPLVGVAGWKERETVYREPPRLPREPLVDLIGSAAEPFVRIDSANLEGLLDRVGDARVVLLGESTHGTAEFYDMRAHITRALIESKGFNIVAVEADWPDAAQIDHFVRQTRTTPTVEKTFNRFPTWMWANVQVLDFVQWLRKHNEQYAHEADAVGFYGLDLYSLYSSVEAVLQYLDAVDPVAAKTARVRYGCLTPWQEDPATYGAAILSGKYRDCEGEVVSMLRELLAKRLEYAAADSKRYFDAERNAHVVSAAEEYYRTMYYGSRSSWNLRDTHMFETLESIMKFRGPAARAVVWEHNSHIGDARATEMTARGEHNVGQLARERWGDLCYSIGFGTDHGTVAAASDWNGPLEIMNVLPATAESYEYFCHETGIGSFLLPLRRPKTPAAREGLMHARLERAIGVIYRPDTELHSHYFHASLPRQFDEYIWFDETRAVNPLGPEMPGGVPETFPYGL
ncbi:MAG TPA: protein-L-isoaspartate(D-aspartate) O-methyltransferase [candidate division Zixibacteria bacterium]|nr:protein-L-isoaspartate(D-aspartate) O-methyltransferase [candidate division Zixibacteria bacterium]